MCAGISQSATVTSLNLRSNPLGAAAGPALRQLLRQSDTLEELVLDSCQLGEGLAAVASGLLENTRLQRLLASNNDGSVVSATGISYALSKNSSLKELSVSYNRFGDHGFVSLARSLLHNSTLACLNLADNEAAGLGVSSLAKCLRENRGLRELDLSGNQASVPACAALGHSLAANVALTTFTFRSANVGAAEMQAFAQALLDSPRAGRSRSLRTLNFAGNEMGPTAGAAWAALVRDDALDVTHLELNGTELGDEGARQLASALKTNTRLLTLSLYNCDIGPVGAGALGESLAPGDSCCSLEALDLGANFLGDTGANWLAKALSGNHHVQRLSLAQNHIGPEGAVALSGLLAANGVLKCMNLEDNPLSSTGVQTLAHGLRQNRGLKRLVLRHVAEVSEADAANQLRHAFELLSRSNQTVSVVRSHDDLKFHWHPHET